MLKLTHHLVVETISPPAFCHRVMGLSERSLSDEVRVMNPATLGCILNLALEAGDTTPFRTLDFMSTCGLVPRGKILIVDASVVTAGAMWEILATERVIRFGRAFPDDVAVENEYEPASKMVEFVKTIRLREYTSHEYLENGRPPECLWLDGCPISELNPPFSATQALARR